ncbi:dTDP-glucose 4,6-dehydratase [Euzebya pacifica]|uniref:dTDP-glucose 4,6-dehydratase n=1 Tax=Euzebya pacifica TaxID=1608957 RepID=A0A346XW09_9ACTN|nr:NAD-dependent epimerase/dehydratase family protein [Euzebya pacifica]AXV06406.1 dTDP-glucose 4,6-dehydratase [Euzebya pacifica]
MRALITGGAGFIGSHLADHLIANGDEVIALDNLSTGRHGNIEHLIGRPDFEFVLGSILNADLVDDCVSRADVVFHLAAAVGVELIVRKPVESLRTNIVGSETVIEKAHKYGKAVLVTSTSEIYGKNTSDSLSEDDDRILGSPLKSRWAYSEAKAIEEILAYTYFREKGLPTVIVRLFNTVGPRQVGHYGMVVPRFVNQALRGHALTVFGDGAQTRCFVDVGDVVPALDTLIRTEGAHGNVFNLGSSDEVSIAELAARIIDLTGSTSQIRKVPYSEAYEEGFEDMERRVPNTSRVHDLIGWAPQRGLDDIIQRVIEEQRS